MKESDALADTRTMAYLSIIVNVLDGNIGGIKWEERQTSDLEKSQGSKYIYRWESPEKELSAVGHPKEVVGVQYKLKVPELMGQDTEYIKSVLDPLFQIIKGCAENSDYEYADSFKLFKPDVVPHATVTASLVEKQAIEFADFLKPLDKVAQMYLNRQSK